LGYDPRRYPAVLIFYIFESMLQSKLFCKTSKEISKETESVSGKLLCRAGFVSQLMAGVYTFLPLGFRVLQKIEAVIRENMAKPPVNGQEMLMPALTPKESWQKTGRWENFDALFKLKGRGEKDYALASTHEEVIAPLAKKIIFSYKDLPFYVFQIQTKFRNEARAKSGILRTREFLMKDLYSFNAEEKDLDAYYDKMDEVYLRIFKEFGIRDDRSKNKITYKTLASGGTFSKYSHEYQTVTESGEDTIYICQKCFVAVNKEIKEKSDICPNCGKKTSFEEKKTVEVGNIFKLGTKYSLPFGLTFRAKDGKEKPVIMGCYGLGLSRIMGAVAEVKNDKNGIIWPRNIAPYLVHLLWIENNAKVRGAAQKIYDDLQKNGVEVLYDDREDKTAGEKFVEADLIGIPFRLVVSEKTLEKNSVEIKERIEESVKLVGQSRLVKLLKMV